MLALPRELDTLYGLFQVTASLYQSPREAFQDDLQSHRLGHVLRELAEMLDMPCPAFQALDLATLQTRYVALFLSHPAGIVAPPYATYALDGCLFGPSMRDLETFFLKHGFSLQDSWRDMPDHIALLAEAASLLLDNDQKEVALELIERFLVPWFNRYADAVAAAEPDFYGPLSQFLARAFKEVSCVAA